MDEDNDSRGRDNDVTHVQVEGVGKHEIKIAEYAYDTSNWEDWTTDQVCEYIEYLLIANNYDKKDIDELMDQVLLEMKITGNVLKILKENDFFSKTFREQIQNHSVDMCNVISQALEQL